MTSLYWRPTNRPTAHLENFKQFLSNGSSNPLHVWF